MATLIEKGEALVLLPPAPPIVPTPFRTPVYVELPDGHRCQMTYAQAEALHEKLCQDLARKMRKRGSSTPPSPDIGGTPMAIAA